VRPNSCRDRGIRLILRRARNEFRDLNDTSNVSVQCGSDREVRLASPLQSMKADFSIITLAVPVVNPNIP